MGKVIFGMMLSLDGFIAGREGGPQLPMPGPALHKYWNDQVAHVQVMLYGRKMYEVMRYWDTADQAADASEVELEFAKLWQAKPKRVVSTTLREVGPNASLVGADLSAEISALKQRFDGEIDVAGPTLAGHLSRLGLIDEYRLYFQPVVLGGGLAFFSEGVSIAELVPLGSEDLPEGVKLLRFGAKARH
ncbi:MAG: dihydrofolate reductase family protein [Polyangiales bacterium]